ncbi:MAG TPA: NAD(P)/FAD-dependent oxidoreductase [Dongiaceae bacterium]|nr:NAD(P)/FAD-dependent oxidoreductase [Dongiaceae bacterium]
MSAENRHRVVIIGAGFGGLSAAQYLAGSGASIMLIDQRNHHIFQPLLYQVATASLATSEIAWPVRGLMKGRADVETRLATVIGIDAAARNVLLEGGAAVGYDMLVVAMGARHAYFGHDDWEPYAPGLKTIEDATRIRRRVLLAFERAEYEADPARRAALLTFVIVGGGPTGVELAGTIAELARDTLSGDFRHIDTQQARVVLIEGSDRILGTYPKDLSDYARRSLEDMGVEVLLGQNVTDCTADGVMRGGVAAAGELLPARTVIWAAGVRASPVGEWLQAPTDRAGRLQVLPDLTVPGHPEIFVIGDTASLVGPDGKPVPGIAPAAKQQGRYVGRVIKARLAGRAPKEPFRYRHQGNLAQIGKRKAIIDFGWIKLKGAVAWWIWGIAHIYFLIGVRSRLNVAINWLWIHARNQRSARLITQGEGRGQG